MPVARRRLPLPVLVVGAIAVYLFIDLLVPVALSMLATRHGWDGQRPGVVNVFGVVPIVVGAVIVWRAGAGHTVAWRELDGRVVGIDRHNPLTPDYLVTDGPYARTRNPLYVGDLVMWTGWVVLVGSVPVLVGFVCLFVGLQLGVRLEERGLARRFGDRWTSYAATTPRFIGRRGR